MILDKALLLELIIGAEVGVVEIIPLRRVLDPQAMTDRDLQQESLVEVGAVMLEEDIVVILGMSEMYEMLEIQGMCVM